MAKIDKLFDTMMGHNGSDLHLSEGQPPKMRTHGRMTRMDGPPLTSDVMTGYLQEICSPERWAHFQENRDLDFAYSMGEKARFRCNYFFQTRAWARCSAPSRRKSRPSNNSACRWCSR